MADDNAALKAFCRDEVDGFQDTPEWWYRAQAWYDGLQYRAMQEDKRAGTKVPLKLVSYGTDFSEFDGTKQEMYRVVFNLIHSHFESSSWQPYLTATFQCPDGAKVTLWDDNASCDCGYVCPGDGENTFCKHKHTVLVAIDIEIPNVLSMGSIWRCGSTNGLITESLPGEIDLWRNKGQGMKTVTRELAAFARELVGKERYRREAKEAREEMEEERRWREQNRGHRWPRL